MIRYIGLGIAAAVIFTCLILSSYIVETNNAGYIQVKQAMGSGELTVRTDPGMYLQNGGTITTYKVSDVYDFNDPSSQINVRFNDASAANISGQIKFRLPLTKEAILKIHTDFRSYEAVHNDLVRQVVAAALKQSATFFRAEDVYSTRRSDFIDLVNDQIKNGIYATVSGEETKRDDLDPTRVVQVKRVEVRNDVNGKPIVNEISAFSIYGIELIQIVINDIDFDEKTDALIGERKQLEQQRVVAVAGAETAKQNALTAIETGKANVAIAEAAALVEAKKATVEAEKNTKVAQQKALQAEEEKKATIARGEADAAATKLKVAAGLSPAEKAKFDMDTAIGVAQALAGVKFPGVMVIGGESNGGKVNPFDAIGIDALLNISKKMVKVDGN